MNYRQNMSPRCQTSSCPMPQPSNASCPSCTRPMPEMMSPTPICPRTMDFPIAMAYVPNQVFQSTYDLHRALEVGTIFPELHKPFCGKRCVR